MRRLMIVVLILFSPAIFAGCRGGERYNKIMDPGGGFYIRILDEQGNLVFPKWAGQPIRPGLQVDCKLSPIKGAGKDFHHANVYEDGRRYEKKKLYTFSSNDVEEGNVYINIPSSETRKWLVGFPVVISAEVYNSEGKRLHLGNNLPAIQIDVVDERTFCKLFPDVKPNNDVNNVLPPPANHSQQGYQQPQVPPVGQPPAVDVEQLQKDLVRQSEALKKAQEMAVQDQAEIDRLRQEVEALKSQLSERDARPRPTRSERERDFVLIEPIEPVKRQKEVGSPPQFTVSLNGQPVANDSSKIIDRVMRMVVETPASAVRFTRRVYRVEYRDGREQRQELIRSYGEQIVATHGPKAPFGIVPKYSSDVVGLSPGSYDFEFVAFDEKVAIATFKVRIEIPRRG